MWKCNPNKLKRFKRVSKYTMYHLYLDNKVHNIQISDRPNLNEQE